MYHSEGPVWEKRAAPDAGIPSYLTSRSTLVFSALNWVLDSEQVCAIVVDVVGRVFTAHGARVLDPTRLHYAPSFRAPFPNKKEELADALEGRLTEHHRFLLRQHMREIRFLDEMISDYDERIEQQVQPFFEYIPLLDSIAGVNEAAAAGILGETGANMNQFPDDVHLNSWAGMCPGNNESAGKHRSGTTRNGNAWLLSLIHI